MAASEVRASTAPVLLFLLAFAIRCIPAPRLFSESVPLFGTDAYYHLRRVLFTLENLPSSLTFDRYINFPHSMAARMSAPTPGVSFARLVYDEPMSLPGDPSRIRIFELRE